MATADVSTENKVSAAPDPARTASVSRKAGSTRPAVFVVIPAPPRFMKTMLSLLTRLAEMRLCCERTERNPHLSDGEKAAPRLFKSLVRGCLPDSVLATYDWMKVIEPELSECPEVFAMAVFVFTYRVSSPAKRRELLSHFADPLPVAQRARQFSGTLMKCRCHSPRLRRRGTATLKSNL